MDRATRQIVALMGQKAMRPLRLTFMPYCQWCGRRREIVGHGEYRSLICVVCDTGEH